MKKTTRLQESTPLALFVAQQVYRRRTALKMTQAELASRSGVTVETIARLERVLRARASANANPSLETLDAIATSLSCHAADLLDGRNKKASDPIVALVRNAKPATRRRIALVVEALLKDERRQRN